jgi:hypothetical protein
VKLYVGSAVENHLIEKPQHHVLPLSKTLAVLQALADSGCPLILSESSSPLGANKSTAIRFCYTLTQQECLRGDEEWQYHLTPPAPSLGCSLKLRREQGKKPEEVVTANRMKLIDRNSTEVQLDFQKMEER